MGTAYELAAFGLQNELTHTKQRCFEHARAKLSEFEGASDDAIIFISEEGNFTVGPDIFETLDEFEKKFPTDTSRRTSFVVESVRHG